MRRFGFLLVSMLVFVGCDDDDDDDKRDGSVLTDGAVMDSGTMDAGPRDAAVDDAAVEDGGPEDSGPRPDAGPVGGGEATSAQIQAVREAGGVTDLPIEGAVVTYTKEEIGNDPAGFFLQAEREGPAIFVAVDPASLTPPAERGQVVNLRVLDVRTEQGRREVTMITDWNVESSGHDTGFLVQNVTAVDLPAMLDDFESELITATFALVGTLRDGGSGFEKISVTTEGAPEPSSMTLRLPSPLAQSFVFEPGCRYTVTATPLWRLTDEVQLSAFDASELSRAECDMPIVAAVVPLNERTVVVRFNRTMDPSSIMGDGSQFNLTTSGAVPVAVTSAMGVAGQNYVFVETAEDLTAGAFFVMTVDSSVQDTAGGGVDPTMNSRNFEGYSPHLVINEVDYDQPGTDDAEFIEIHNPSLNPIPLTGLEVHTINGVEGTVTQATIELVPNSENVTELAPGGYLLVLTPSSGALTVPAGVPTVMLGSNLQNDEEGVVLLNPTSMDCHDAVFYEGLPTATSYMGCDWELNAGTDPGPGSLSRIPNGIDTNENPVDFRLTPTPTPGAENVP